MQSKEIVLPNRYGDRNILVPTGEENKYRLELSSPRLRVLYDTDENNLSAIDPSGGPFIPIGYHVPKLGYVKSITKSEEGYVLEISKE